VPIEVDGPVPGSLDVGPEFDVVGLLGGDGGLLVGPPGVTVAVPGVAAVPDGVPPAT